MQVCTCRSLSVFTAISLMSNIQPVIDSVSMENEAKISAMECLLNHLQNGRPTCIRIITAFKIAAVCISPYFSMKLGFSGIEYKYLSLVTMVIGLSGLEGTVYTFQSCAEVPQKSFTREMEILKKFCFANVCRPVCWSVGRPNGFR